MPENKASLPIATTIAPWLSVRNGARAVDFYKSAFGATEVFRMDGDGDGDGGSVVARLALAEAGAEFWVGTNLLSTSTSARSLLAAVPCASSCR